MEELRGRDFVGTESRLNTIFELLRQMVFGAEEDPDRRASCDGERVVDMPRVTFTRDRADRTAEAQ